jgi:hypothetical protein
MLQILLHRRRKKATFCCRQVLEERVAEGTDRQDGLRGAQAHILASKMQLGRHNGRSRCVTSPCIDNGTSNRGWRRREHQEWFMNKIPRSNLRDVLSLRLARERASQSNDGSNGHAFKRLGLSVWNSEITELDGQSVSNQRSLERLEAENAQLRGSVVDLMLQIQALREGVIAESW